MKLTLFSIIISLMFFNCTTAPKDQKDLTPVYFDFENALQEKNLYGNVKRIEYYKTESLITQKTKEPILNKIEEYTNFGEIEKVERYNQRGNLIQIDHLEYNDKNDWIKTISIDKTSNSITSTRVVKYDSTHNIHKRLVYKNDTLNYQSVTYSNNNNDPLKNIVIKKNDTVAIVDFEHRYNSKNQIIFTKRNVIDDNYKYSNSEKNIYDDNNRLIKCIYLNEVVKSEGIYDWKQGRIIQITSYLTSSDSIRNISNITKFDSLNNTTYSKEFEDSDLKNEIKIDYEFDENGNWINKTVYRKKHKPELTDFEVINVYRRKIGYW